MRRVRVARSRWRNVPVPEPHVGGLLAGGVLHLVRPWPLTSGEWVTWAIGGLLLLAGTTVVAWSVVAVGRQTVAAPTSPVTAGPYRYSRNPMYVGWTALYIGVATLANTAWPVVLVPIVALFVHRTVRREEHALDRRFGEEYRAYRREVRRYV